MMNREKERIQIAMIRDPDPQARTIVMHANRLTEETIKKVATSYYQACQFYYEPTFFAWRNKIKQFREQGLEDLNDGYNNPFMAPRGIQDMEEIKYQIDYRKPSLQKFLAVVSRNTRKKFRYYMNVQEQEELFSDEGDDATQNKSKISTVNQSARDGVKSPPTQQTEREKQKLRQTNKEYATLEEAIKKQEDKFQATILTYLKNAAYFPPRPAMKFIPTPIMIHQLIHQALQMQHTKLEAPESFVTKYDINSETVSKQIGSAQSKPMETRKSSNSHFNTINESSRLQTQKKVIEQRESQALLDPKRQSHNLILPSTPEANNDKGATLDVKSESGMQKVQSAASIINHETISNTDVAGQVAALALSPLDSHANHDAEVIQKGSPVIPVEEADESIQQDTQVDYIDTNLSPTINIEVATSGSFKKGQMTQAAD